MNRRCADCPTIITTGHRCPTCQRAYRARYQGAWPATSRAAIARSPVCIDCGATTDLTAEHLEPDKYDPDPPVLCRPCNSRRARARATRQPGPSAA